MEYKDLKEINNKLKTIDVKGKNYVEVNERIKAFREICPNGSIETNIEHLENGVVVMSCTIKDENGKVLSKAHAYEKENSTFINKTSFIENCCTSATGRALGYLGIGIDTSVASAEEVQNAIIQQDDDKVIDKTKVDALNKSIENAGIKDEVVELILSQYGYTSTNEIKIKDYMQIISDFKSRKEN